MRREIDVQQAFSHRNIMPIVDWDGSDKPSWFTMPIAQYIVEDHHRDLASDEGSLIGMLDDVISALRYAHKQGYVHRDVAPQNILFLEDRWVLADWGSYAGL